MHRWLKFLPAAFFLAVWCMLLNSSVGIEKAMKKPLGSKTFITTFGQAFDNPLVHNSAIRFYFIKLLRDDAPPHVWAASQPYAWALWHQYQYDGSVEIMLAIAHQSDNVLEERRWAEEYAATHPGQARAAYYLRHAFHGHARHEPLKLVGKW